MKKLFALFASLFALAAPLPASAIDAATINEPCVVCEDFAALFFGDDTPAQPQSTGSYPQFNSGYAPPQDPETGSYYSPVSGGYFFFPGTNYGYSGGGFSGYNGESPCAFCQQYCPLCNFDAPQPPVPEPGTYAMLLAGLIPLAVAVRRRRKLA